MMSEVSTQEQAVASEVAELEEIISLLEAFTSLCARVDEQLIVTDETRCQELLAQLAAGLAYIPKSLQRIQDYRRYVSAFTGRAQKLYEDLQTARRNAGALSSEEERVIAAVASLHETLLASIDSLEQLLGHARTHTHELLSVLAYQGDAFASFTQPILARIDIPFLCRVSGAELQRFQALKRDVLELRAFEVHVQELRGEQ